MKYQKISSKNLVEVNGGSVGVGHIGMLKTVFDFGKFLGDSYYKAIGFKKI